MRHFEPDVRFLGSKQSMEFEFGFKNIRFGYSYTRNCSFLTI